MKLSRLLLITLLVSAYATITVVHINMAQPKPVAEATLEMIEIMTRAFDESEGGEGGSEPRWMAPQIYNCTIETYADGAGRIFAFGKWWPINAEANAYFYVSASIGVNCQDGGDYLCSMVQCVDALKTYFGVDPEPDPM